MQFKCCFQLSPFTLRTDFDWPKRQDSRAKLQIRRDLTQIRKKSVFPGLVTVKTKENCEPANQVKIAAATLRKIHSAPPAATAAGWRLSRIDRRRGRSPTHSYALKRERSNRSRQREREAVANHLTLAVHHSVIFIFHARATYLRSVGRGSPNFESRSLFTMSEVTLYNNTRLLPPVAVRASSKG